MLYTLISLGTNHKSLCWAEILRERSLFMGGGGPVQIGGGINFSASKLRGGKISVQAFRGGQNFSAQTFEGQPEAPEIYPKNFRRR